MAGSRLLLAFSLLVATGCGTNHELTLSPGEVDDRFGGGKRGSVSNATVIAAFVAPAWWVEPLRVAGTSVLVVSKTGATTMKMMIDINPELEQGHFAQARARGISVSEYVNEIVARELPVSPDDVQRTGSGQRLVDVCAEVRGLLSDEEIDTIFARN